MLMPNCIWRYYHHKYIVVAGVEYMYKEHMCIFSYSLTQSDHALTDLASMQHCYRFASDAGILVGIILSSSSSFITNELLVSNYLIFKQLVSMDSSLLNSDAFQYMSIETNCLSAYLFV